MGLIRVLRTTQVNLSHTFYVDGSAQDATGTVTVSITRMDGTAVASGNANTGTVGDGKYEFTLPGTATQQVDTLVVDWTGTFSGVSVVARDYVEVVGGFLFGIQEARADSSGRMADTVKYPSAKIAERRTEVEQECERICGVAWVPRFTRLLLDGSGTDSLITPDVELRKLRAASVADRAGASFTPLSVGDLAAVAVLPSGVLIRGDGQTWPEGRQNVLVEYEHGMDMPPGAIRTAAIRHLRYLLESERSSIPERAMSWAAPGGGAVYRITVPSADKIGVPDVDGTYERYARGGMGFA